MKVTNVLKNVGVGVLVMMLVGCASVGSVTNKMVNNTQGGVIFGVGGIDSETSVREVCKLIKNKDARCAHPDEFVAVAVISKFGSSS